MATMNISLPDDLKAFVDEQVAARAYGSASEFLRALIRDEAERQRFRSLILEGLGSRPSVEAGDDFFEELRTGVRTRAAG
jgi:antitoxin ParD1/3/4